MPRLKGQTGHSAIAQMAVGCTEAEVLRAAVERCQGSTFEAARSLGIERTTLWYHLHRQGLQDLPRQIREQNKRKFLL